MAGLLRALLDRTFRRARTAPPRRARARRRSRRRTQILRSPEKRRQTMTPDSYGVLTEPATLTIQRLLPGPAERIWAYLTKSELRRQWLAAGEMEMKVGAAFELVWRN